ncbi:hypothetical protein [Actinoplanes sp. NPDC026670]|uniref:hypothetical protein n=1 Tax=Actinoplanes sp. NPDC026670 TaxID=3154700 RepID=UPI003408309C
MTPFGEPSMGGPGEVFRGQWAGRNHEMAAFEIQDENCFIHPYFRILAVEASHLSGLRNGFS